MDNIIAIVCIFIVVLCISIISIRAFSKQWKKQKSTVRRVTIPHYALFMKQYSCKADKWLSIKRKASFRRNK